MCIDSIKKIMWKNNNFFLLLFLIKLGRNLFPKEDISDVIRSDLIPGIPESLYSIFFWLTLYLLLRLFSIFLNLFLNSTNSPPKYFILLLILLIFLKVTQ